MVWCGLVWCDVVWCDVVCCGGEELSGAMEPRGGVMLLCCRGVEGGGG